MLRKTILIDRDVANLSRVVDEGLRGGRECGPGAAVGGEQGVRRLNQIIGEERQRSEETVKARARARGIVNREGVSSELSATGPRFGSPLGRYATKIG